MQCDRAQPLLDCLLPEQPGGLVGVALPPSVHEVRRVRHVRPFGEGGGEPVGFAGEGGAVVGADVVPADRDGHHVRCPAEGRNGGDLGVEDIADTGAALAQVDDLDGFPCALPEAVGEQADVAMLRVTGPDGLRGAVAERDVQQAAGLPLGLGPVLRVRAGAERDLAELHDPDTDEDQDGGEQRGGDGVPPDPCGHRGPPASPCPAPARWTRAGGPVLGHRPGVGARAVGQSSSSRACISVISASWAVLIFLASSMAGAYCPSAISVSLASIAPWWCSTMPSR